MSLAFLIENELEKAELVLAAKAILDKFQGMAEDLAKIEADDIMPILDQLKATFGPDVSKRFNDVATAKVRAVIEATKAAKDAISTEVQRMEGGVDGGPMNDMAAPEDTTADLASDLSADTGLDMATGTGDLGDAALPDDGADAEDLGDDDLDPDLDDGDLSIGDEAFADDGKSAAGRAKKESIIRSNINMLRESADPERLIVSAFRMHLKEGYDAGGAAHKVAESFALDLEDVVVAVREAASKKH